MSSVIPAFSVPIAAFQVPNLEALNEDLLKLITQSETHEKSNLNPSQKIQPEVFESNFQFLDWEQACCKHLKELVLAGLKKVILESVQISASNLSAKAVNMDSWFHVTRRGGYVQPHNHPNASWSLVYCVADGVKDEGHTDSGALVFHNPLAGTMFQDGTNGNFKSPFSTHSQKFVLKPSQLVIFPSYLTHSVTPYIGDGERVTIAANVWFK